MVNLQSQIRQFKDKKTAYNEVLLYLNDPLSKFSIFLDLLSEEVPQLNAQVLKLPYYGEKAHMLIILPNENTPISQVSDVVKKTLMSCDFIHFA
jgi:hypothetical protein